MKTITSKRLGLRIGAFRPGRSINPDTLASDGSVLVLTGLYCCYALLSSGVYVDDDLQHFLLAHCSRQHPQLLLDYWGRPALTLLYAPASALGFTAARLFSVLLAFAPAPRISRIDVNIRPEWR